MTNEVTIAERRLKFVYTLAVAVSAMSVALIVAGALVTSTGSGDAIPDWPTSYGAVIPSQLSGGVLAEWSHRAIAGVVALLIAALTFSLALSSQPRWVKFLGVVVFVAVLVQAVLGGLRVLVVSNEKVQTTTLTILGLSQPEVARIAFGVAHAVLAQIVLSLSFIIAFVTKPNFRISVPTGLPSTFTVASALVVFLVFVQLLFGAVMRHTNSGLIIPDFPTSFGRLFPPFGNLPVDEKTLGILTREEFAFRVAVNFAHRLNGFLTALAIAFLCWIVHRNSSLKGSLVHRLTSIQFGLVVLQILLGGLTVWTKLSVPVTIAHVAVGATLMGVSTLVLLQPILFKQVRSPALGFSTDLNLRGQVIGNESSS